MRKYHTNRSMILVAGGIIILMFMLFFSTKPGSSTCTADRECAPKMEDLQDGDMFWESISRQFVSSVSYQ